MNQELEIKLTEKYFDNLDFLAQKERIAELETKVNELEVECDRGTINVYLGTNEKGTSAN